LEFIFSTFIFKRLTFDVGLQ